MGGPLSALSQIMLQGLPRRGSLRAGVECARSEMPSRQLGVAAAAAAGNSALVWLPAACTHEMTATVFCCRHAGKVCVADRQGQKHPPEARMIRSGQLALRWPNSYCQACERATGACWRMWCGQAVDERSVDRVVGVIQGVRAGEGVEDVAAALRLQRS